MATLALNTETAPGTAKADTVSGKVVQNFGAARIYYTADEATAAARALTAAAQQLRAETQGAAE
ncbi:MULTISPECIES: hypothetical protein [Stenotrophomonas]|uniref:hypothetical protein n=1 Tax=Stenotrophomonas TaxID=40323 RepID=UPI002E75A5E9|nr:hypothetical protein [Stenotrophomonas geniculata]